MGETGADPRIRRPQTITHRRDCVRRIALRPSLPVGRLGDAELARVGADSHGASIGSRQSAVGMIEAGAHRVQDVSENDGSRHSPPNNFVEEPIEVSNEDPMPFVSAKTADEIPGSIK